jgi:hypothetical protein
VMVGAVLVTWTADDEELPPPPPQAASTKALNIKPIWLLNFIFFTQSQTSSYFRLKLGRKSLSAHVNGYR